MVELERMYPSDAFLYSETSHLTTDEEDAECNGDSSSDISPYQSAFLANLKSRDKGKRAKAVDCMATCLEQWARSSEDVMAQRCLTAHLPIALRLTMDSPFADIRERLKKVLEQLKGPSVNVPVPAFDSPSAFIPNSEVVQIDVDQVLERPIASLSKALDLFQDAFLVDLRVSHLVQLMGYHPEYLRIFLTTHHLLMHGDGPLANNVRVYIAILAASRHCCGYLVSVLEPEFLACGGDKKWLHGLHHLPPKLYNLLKLNRILAHQPWNISPKDIKELLIGPDSWSITELTQAIVIMAHYHSLAGFALGCGVTPEVDTPCGHTFNQDTPIATTFSNPSLCLTNDVAVETALSEGSVVSGGGSCVSPMDVSPFLSITSKRVEHYMQSSDVNNCPLRDMLRTVEESSDHSEEETVEQKDAYYAASLSTREMEAHPITPIPVPPVVSKYLDEPNFTHQDTLSLAKMRSTEYSWEDHGYPLVSRFFSEAASYLDEKFDVAYSLTYRKVGKEEGVDTVPFRRAAWFYIQSIKGIRRDDYNYKEVNRVLTISFKTYIRMVACFPEQVRLSNFETRSELGLEYSEMVHINLIVLEARLQAELLYALRAMMLHMK